MNKDEIDRLLLAMGRLDDASGNDIALILSLASKVIELHRGLPDGHELDMPLSVVVGRQYIWALTILENGGVVTINRDRSNLIK